MKSRRKNAPFPLLSLALAMLMLLGAAGCGQDPVDARFAGLAEGTDGASPRDICGLWMIDGAAWAVTASSLARCEDGRSVDFPTYMVQWSLGSGDFITSRNGGSFPMTPQRRKQRRFARSTGTPMFSPPSPTVTPSPPRSGAPRAFR